MGPKKTATVKIKPWLITVTLPLFLVVHSLPCRTETLPKGTSSVHDPLDNLSSAEKERFREIVRMVGKPDVAITPQIRREFWGLMDKAGKISQEQAALVRDLMFGAATVYMRYFYEDALEALKEHQPFKSLQREQYEKQLLKVGAMAEWRVKQNEDLIRQIANRKSIDSPQGKVLLDETVIRRILTGLEVAGQRINLLFTRP